jgi:hypothetical protein
VLFLAGLLLEASACIFDQGDYKQGGRLEHAATAQAQNQGGQDPFGDDDGTSGTTGTSGSSGGTSGGTSGAAGTSSGASVVDAGDSGVAQ